MVQSRALGLGWKWLGIEFVRLLLLLLFGIFTPLVIIIYTIALLDLWVLHQGVWNYTFPAPPQMSV